MSWSKGLKFERYLRLFSTPVSPGEPKGIGVDDTYCDDGSCLLVAAYSNDPTALGKRDLGAKQRGSGFYLDEVPPVNFSYLVIPKAFVQLAERVSLYSPASRQEEFANGNFFRYMVNIDGTAFLLSRIMGRHDRVLVHGYWRPEIVEGKIVRKLAAITGQDVPAGAVKCGGSETKTPALRAADNIGYRLRNRVDGFSQQRIEFTGEDLLAMNLNRHELREFRRAAEADSVETGFDIMQVQAANA